MILNFTTSETYVHLLKHEWPMNARSLVRRLCQPQWISDGVLCPSCADAGSAWHTMGTMGPLVAEGQLSSSEGYPSDPLHATGGIRAFGKPLRSETSRPPLLRPLGFQHPAETPASVCRGQMTQSGCIVGILSGVSNYAVDVVQGSIG